MKKGSRFKQMDLVKTQTYWKTTVFRPQGRKYFTSIGRLWNFFLTNHFLKVSSVGKTFWSYGSPVMRGFFI